MSAEPYRMPTGALSPHDQARLDQFKAYAVSHPLLEQVDSAVMRAIHEPAGFAHVLVYGPTGVGKSTMIRRIEERLNGRSGSVLSTLPPFRQGPAMHVLILETLPPDSRSFDRADYYRMALKRLGEPFYERRTLVDIDTEQSWERKGKTRTKAAQFNDSPELRHALEDALLRHGIQATLLDEAQHLMKVASGAKLLDQLDWIKSMTNVTRVLHILIGTYELLDFRNLSGQASRRGLDIHFPRYQFQHEADRLAFQGVVLALLKQMPLQMDVAQLMRHWMYFYERSIGCVGVLKDWLVRTLSSALLEGRPELTLARLQDHALSPAQCERMAMEATAAEQKLRYTESSREHLWSLLGMSPSDGSPSAPLPVTPVAAAASLAERKGHIGEAAPATMEAAPKTTTRRKRQADPTTDTAATSEVNTASDAAAAPKKRTRKGTTPDASAESIETSTPKPRARKKAAAEPAPQAVTPMAVATGDARSTDTQTDSQSQPKKTTTRRVGQRKPQRDPVGE